METPSIKVRLDPAILTRIDKFAANNGLDRSAAIRYLLISALKGVKL